MQKLLGHSDPKITERRYGHLLPDFMKSEVDGLRFGLDRLAPTLPASGAGEVASGGESLEFAEVGGRLGTPVVRNARIEIGRVIPLTVREVASVLRVNRATIYSGVARGTIPHVRLGHAVRIPVLPTA